MKSDEPNFNAKITIGASIAAAAALSMGAISGIVAYCAHRTEITHAPAGRFVDVAGVRFHYLEAGSGPPLVLIHGNAFSSDDFVASGIVGPLAQRHRVIIIDRPGFGYTTRPRGTDWTPIRQAELIYQVLLKLKVVNPIVVGHSLGSLVAVALAIAQPGYARALVLLSGYYFPTASSSLSLLAAPAMPVIGDVMQLTVLPVFARLAEGIITEQLFAPSPVAKSFSQYPLSMSRRPSQIRATLEDTKFLDRSVRDLEPHYGELTLPIEILAGDGDMIVETSTQSKRLSDELPAAHYSTVAGAGHMIHHIAPDRVLAAIAAVERRSPPSSAGWFPSDAVA